MKPSPRSLRFKFHTDPILNGIVSIGKPLNRQKGDPDYVIKGKRWDVWVYPDKVSERSDPWDSRSNIFMDKEHCKPLYDLLGSNGNESMAMLYKEYVRGPMPHLNLNNFPDLSTGDRVQLLVYFMLYEPHKINWVDIAISRRDVKGRHEK